MKHTRIIRNRILLIVLLAAIFLWLVIPIALAVLWSLVDPEYTWSYPDIFPKRLSFRRWPLLWETTMLKQSMINSYTLGIAVTFTTLALAWPTAYAFGRTEFPGKKIAETLVLLPMILPGFVVAILFSSLLISLGIYSRFLGILIGHCVILLPYAIRILAVSFSLVRQDLIDAARDQGARALGVFRHAYLPTLKPGIIAALIIVLIRSVQEFAPAFVIGSPDFTTVPTILFSYLGYSFIRPNAAVISLVPAVPNILLMIILERWLQDANPAAMVGKE